MRDFETTLLAARMAHVAAAERRVRIYRDAAYPQRMVMRVDGEGFDFETVWPDLVRAELDTLDEIGRHFVAGCAALAGTDPLGVDLADRHFRRVLEVAGVRL